VCGSQRVTFGRLGLQHSGVSLIEVLTVIVIVAILTTLAVPSFRDVTQRNRIASQINSFIADLQFARSEAIKRGVSVTVCPSTSGAACSGLNAWHSGWIVFSDVDQSGSVNGSDQVLRRQTGLSNSDTFRVTPAANVVVTYNREGFANFGASTLKMATSPVNSNATRCVAINRVGRHQVQSLGTGSCA
jgi:type IV fimbrial biogenesis protein FimT